MKKKNEVEKICYVVGKWNGGGVESVVMNYYKNIDRKKYQIDFLCDSDSTNIPYDDIKKMGGEVILIPPYQKVFKYQKFLTNLFKEKEYNIVHSHINALSIFPLRAAKKAGVPIRIAHSHSTTSKAEFKRNLLKNILKSFSKIYATDYFCCSELAGRWLFGDKTYDDNKVFLLNNAIDVDKFKELNLVVSNIFVSQVIVSENSHNNPDAWASTPTTGNPSYNDGSKKTSNA